MLKLTLRPGEFIDIGENVRVIFSGGSANNIHLLVDAPREINADVCVDCGACAGVCPVGAPNPQQTTYNYSLNVFQDTKKEPEIKDIPCFRFFFDIKNISFISVESVLL